LAQLLRAELLPEAWIAPQQVRDLRALLRHRASLVRRSTSLNNRVHAVLADRGIWDHLSLWTGRGRAWLADMELPPIPRGILRWRPPTSSAARSEHLLRRSRVTGLVLWFVIACADARQRRPQARPPHP
jgi:hypothetical protein